MALRREELEGCGREATIYAFPAPALAARRRRETRRARAARRRRGLGVVAVVISLFLLSNAGGGAPSAAPDRPTRVVVLQQGDSVWEVAERHAPHGVDLRAYVDLVLEVNRLDGVPQPGTKLRLP